MSIFLVQQGLDCNAACIKRGQFDAGCQCDNDLASSRMRTLMNRNPIVNVLGRYHSIDRWYVIGTYSYRTALLMLQEDPMNRKIGEVLWSASTPVS